MSTIRDPVQDVGSSTPSTYQEESQGTAVGRADKRPGPDKHFGAILGSPKKRAPIRSSARQDDTPDQSATSLLELSLRGFRAEVPSDASEANKVRPPLRMAPHQRILVGCGGSNEHARIQIEGGHLAGSEIRLALVGTHIDAQLLTRNEGSRQTLVAAMDAVRERLRARGLLLRAATGESPRDCRHRNPQRREQESHRGAREKV